MIRRYEYEHVVDLSSDNDEHYEEYKCDRRFINASSSKDKGKQVSKRRK